MQSYCYEDQLVAILCRSWLLICASDSYFHTGGRLTFGTLPPQNGVHGFDSNSDGFIAKADEGTRDVDAQDHLGKAIILARESLWNRRRNHRVGVRRTLQRWQTTRTARCVEIARSKLSGIDRLSKGHLDKIVGMVRRYTASPHLTRDIRVRSDVDQAEFEEEIEACDEEVDDIVSCLYSAESIFPALFTRE
eukprot:COSAG02_NODE_3099_length_7378_cov_3.046984_4_plen_192_part_00